MTWVLLSCLLVMLIIVAVLLFLAVAAGKFLDNITPQEW